MLFWLGEIWSNFCDNKFLKVFFFLKWSLASETTYKNVDWIIFTPFCMRRSKNENLFENCHLCQRKVETHLRCVAPSARGRSGSAAGPMPPGHRAAQMEMWRAYWDWERQQRRCFPLPWNCVLTTNDHMSGYVSGWIDLSCTKMYPRFCLFKSQ